MRRAILIPLLIVLIVLAIAGGVGYYIYNGYMYYSTDDAQVSGNIVSVYAPANGRLTTLDVKVGDTIKQGQTIGTITTAATGAAGAAATATTVNVTSPINGTVLQTSAVQGQGVVAGLTVVQLTDLTQLTVTAYIDESQMNNVKVGQDVDIHVDAFSGTTFSGKVQTIVQAAASTFSLLPTQDNASGNFTKVGQRVPVIITLDGTGGNDVVPGLSATVTIHLH